MVEPRNYDKFQERFGQILRKATGEEFQQLLEEEDAVWVKLRSQQGGMPEEEVERICRRIEGPVEFQKEGSSIRETRVWRKWPMYVRVFREIKEKGQEKWKHEIEWSCCDETAYEYLKSQDWERGFVKWFQDQGDIPIVEAITFAPGDWSGGEDYVLVITLREEKPYRFVYPAAIRMDPSLKKWTREVEDWEVRDDEDLRQELLLGLCNTMRKMNPSLVEKTDAYLAMAIECSAVDYLRREALQLHGERLRRTEREISSGEPAEYVEDEKRDPSLDVLLEPEVLVAISDHFENLPIDDVDRKIVLLRLRGWTYKKIGKHAGMSAPAVHKRLKKIQGKFKEGE